MKTVMFRGHPACTCLVAWLLAYEQLLIAKGIIKQSIDIYQLIGGAPASAGTHRPGGAYDIAQRSVEAIRLAREMGSCGWDRPYDWDNAGGMPHHHGILRGCPHVTGPVAVNQISAYAAGYNGLGHLGRGGRDQGPKVTSRRTWQQGIEWAKAQLPAVVDLTVATANLCELPRHDATVDDDLREIEALGTDLILFQEGSNPVYRSTIRRTLKRLKTVVLRSQNDFDTPISYNPKKLIPTAAHAVRLIQKGWSGVTPNRYMASQHFALPGVSLDLVAHDLHPIAGAWDADGGVHRKGATILKRQSNWRASRKVALGPIRMAARKGLPQIIGSDTNRHKVGLNLPAVLEGRRVQKAWNGFDWLYFIDGAKYQWILVGPSKAVKTHSDHRVVVQRVRLVTK